MKQSIMRKKILKIIDIILLLTWLHLIFLSLILSHLIIFPIDYYCIIIIIFVAIFAFFNVPYVLYSYEDGKYWEEAVSIDFKGIKYVKNFNKPTTITQETKCESENKYRTEYVIGFVGDIMPMEEYFITPSVYLQEFFRDADLIVGNLEGVLIPMKEPEFKSDPNVIEYIKGNKFGANITGVNCKRFKMKILDFLGFIAHPFKWLLSVSNNHSGDFQTCRFRNMLKILERCEFNYFGVGSDLNKEKYNKNDMKIKIKKAYCEEIPLGVENIKYPINIQTGTMWINKRKFKRSRGKITFFDDVQKKIKPCSFNVLFPHWHFENETYIRNSFKHKSLNLVRYGTYKSSNRAEKIFNDSKNKNTWDIVFGHHSHIPQHIEFCNEREINKISETIPNKIIAYSGGNFTSGEPRQKHRHGLIAKFYLKPNDNQDKLEIDKVLWSFTFNEGDKKNNENPRKVVLNYKMNKKGKINLNDVLN